jgi:hypothetical protein
MYQLNNKDIHLDDAEKRLSEKVHGICEEHIKSLVFKYFKAKPLAA